MKTYEGVIADEALVAWKSRGLRRMAMGKYTVLYHVDDKAGKVTITRVLYASGDLQTRL